MSKRIASLLIMSLLIILSMIGCSSTNHKNNAEYSVKYATGIFLYKNWESSIGTYTGVAIPDEACAIAVAQAIYDAMPNEESKGRVPISVFFDEPDEIWIVCFGYPPKNGVYVFGGDCCIALRKTDGKVLRIWFGE